MLSADVLYMNTIAISTDNNFYSYHLSVKHPYAWMHVVVFGWSNDCIAFCTLTLLSLSSYIFNKLSCQLQYGLEPEKKAAGCSELSLQCQEQRARHLYQFVWAVALAAMNFNWTKDKKGSSVFIRVKKMLRIILFLHGKAGRFDMTLWVLDTT